MNLRSFLNVGLLLSFLIAQPVSAGGGDKKIKDKEMKLSIREIMDKYYSRGRFYFGASSEKEYMTKPNYRSDQFFNEFSYNTPENSFKQSTVYATNGLGNERWRSEEYLYFIKMARENKQVIRAHGPVSPQSNKWAKADIRTKEELDDMLTRFMTNLSMDVEKNSDVIKWMDVVNECFAGSKQKGLGYNREFTEDVFVYQPYDWFGPRKGVDKWENPWPYLGFETITVDGQTFEIPKYIIKSFAIATKFAPSVKLLWNDHGKEIDPKLYGKLKLVVKYLRSIGLRVDGIGWQSHVMLGWENDPENIKNLEDVIDWCYQNNLEFHITELDVTVDQKKGAKELAYDVLEKTRSEQAETFGAVLETMLKKVGKGATALNVWTMYDHMSSDGSTFAGMFDEDGNPNLAYYKVKELLLKYGRELNK